MRPKLSSRHVISWRLFNSMDGKGRAIDDVVIERLSRTVNYENIYPKKYASGSTPRRPINTRKLDTDKSRVRQLWAISHFTGQWQQSSQRILLTAVSKTEFQNGVLGSVLMWQKPFR